MMSLGLIDEERLLMLPPDYWASHEFCFFLHDKLVELLTEYESQGVHNVVRDALFSAAKESGLESKFIGMDIIDFLKDGNLIEPYRQHIVSHLVLALTSDMLHFLHEALMCFEKRKFSVAFSLLRKPLKEHLLYLSWILADEEDFITRFESDDNKRFNIKSKNGRTEIIKEAIDKLLLKEAFDAELIHDLIYAKNFKHGFEVNCQRATHLITSYSELLKTDSYSFNFIFEDASDDYYYLTLKENLPYIFLYLSQISLASFHRLYPISKRAVNHTMALTMGCYEALFHDGRSLKMTRLFQKSFGDLLSCVHCEHPFKLKKVNAPEFYLHEQFTCEKCGAVSEFPLYWIMAKYKMEFIDS